MPRLQVPGNSKLFDSELRYWKNKKTSHRTIILLKFLDEHKGISNKDEINFTLGNFLERNGLCNNETNKLHLFRELIAYGLVNNTNNDYYLTTTGSIFFNYIKSGMYKEATQSLISSMLEFHYPSISTPSVKRIYLYPVKLFFKLILERKSLSKDFMSNIFPYLDECKKIEEYKNYKCAGDNYKKWVSWFCNMLVDMNIIIRDENNYSLSSNWEEYLSKYLSPVTYEELYDFYIIKYNEGLLEGKGTSLAERNIFNLINSFFYQKEVLCQYRGFADPKTKKKWEFDIYLPEINFAIEYNGTYFHDKNEFENDNTENPKTKEMRKSKFAKENNIELIHIWEDDYSKNPLKMNKEILKIIETKFKNLKK